MFDPFYNRLINIIVQWDKKVPPLEMKKITAIPGKDHPTLCSYLDYLYALNRSTQRLDRQGIRTFLKWLTENIPTFNNIETTDIDVKKISLNHLKLYEKYQENKANNGLFTYEYCCSSLLQPLKRWFEFLELHKIVLINPTKRWKFIWKRTEKDFEVMTDNQFQIFFNTVYENSPTPLRDIALFSVYFSTGLRSVSNLGTKVGDFDPINGTLKVTLKGGNEHLQKLPPIVVINIERYLKSRPIENFNEPLWLSRKNVQISISAVQRKFKKYKILAGIVGNHGSVHSFRHYFLSVLAESGESINTIVESIGGNNVNSFNTYLRPRKDILVTDFYGKCPNFSTSLGGEKNENSYT